MNPVQWFFFNISAVVSLAFTLYRQWVLWRYVKPSYQTIVTGCEVARYVLDQAGLVHISVSPMDPGETDLSMEGLFLTPRIYEGRDFMSITQAARQAFLKSQLANLTFWIRLKKRLAFIMGFTVLSGWLFLIAGSFVPVLEFLINLGLGCFMVVMCFALFDLPSEFRIQEKVNALLRRSGHFQQNEFQSGSPFRCKF